jgi:oligoribonuclease
MSVVVSSLIFFLFSSPVQLTGLEDHGKIMEIACLVTDPNLEILGDGVDIVVHQPDEVLNSMNAWCTEHHAKVR